MKPPLIIQFAHEQKRNELISGWFKKQVWKTTYSRMNGEVRKFTDSFNQDLIEHFVECPPKVGDLIFIEGCFRIIKAFWNVNHGRYEIWWTHDCNAATSDVVEYSGHQEPT